MIQFYSKDVGVQLLFTILKQDQTPFDLTGATAALYVPSLGAASPFALTIVDAVAGVVSYTVTVASTFPSGKLKAQIKVLSGASVFRTGEFEMQVLPSSLTP